MTSDHPDVGMLIIDNVVHWYHWYSCPRTVRYSRHMVDASELSTLHSFIFINITNILYDDFQIG